MPLEIHPERTVELTSLNKDDRGRLREIVGAVLAASFIGSLLIYAVSSLAEEIPVHVVDQQMVKMRLLSSPCADPVSLAMIATAPPKWHDKFKAISSQWLGKDGSWSEFAGCWMELTKEEAGTPENVFVLVFSDGASAMVLRSELLKRPGDKGA